MILGRPGLLRRTLRSVKTRFAADDQQDPRDFFIFSPQYLEQMDRYRGYRRKIMLRKLYLNVTETDTSTGLRHFVKHFVSEDMKDDVRRRRKVYLSDWTDALQNKRKIVPAILFLYFACLSPAVSFGTIASQITQGSMGIVEFLLSAGVSGMAYALFCGQPMAFIAPTGLTLAFISGLFRFCTVNSLPFFPVYSWVGIWTSFFFVMLGLGGCSQWIRFCTRFTDEVFNALLSLNFIAEAVASLKRNFDLADPSNLTMPFVSLAMALTTYMSTLQVATFESSKYLNQKIRSVVKDFGPVTIFVLMSLFNSRPYMQKFGVPTLSVAPVFQLAGGRNFLVNLNGVSTTVKLMCALPAVLLTSLFFMDQVSCFCLLFLLFHSFSISPSILSTEYKCSRRQQSRQQAKERHGLQFGHGCAWNDYRWTFSRRLTVDVWGNRAIAQSRASHDGNAFQRDNR